MASQADQVARRRGLVTGVAIAVAATLAAYLALWLPPHPFIAAVVWALFVGPIFVGLVLLCIPRTRVLAVGLLLGVAATWIVSVPACVVVAMGTVPDLTG